MPRPMQATMNGVATNDGVKRLETELQQVTAVVHQLREMVRKQGQEIDLLKSRVATVERRR